MAKRQYGQASPPESTPVDAARIPQFRYGSVAVRVQRDSDGRHCIYVSGTLLRDGVTGLAELIAGELAHQPRQLILDLSHVNRIDPDAAHLLPWATTQAGGRGVPLSLVGLSQGLVASALATRRPMSRVERHHPSRRTLASRP